MDFIPLVTICVWLISLSSSLNTLHPPLSTLQQAGVMGTHVWQMGQEDEMMLEVMQ